MSNDTLTEVRFWAQIIGDAKRTVFCAPDLESRIKGWVDARGMGGIITVIASPGCPEGRIFIADTPAMQATMNQAMSRPITIWPR
jgi:hypothetical protein